MMSIILRLLLITALLGKTARVKGRFLGTTCASRYNELAKGCPQENLRVLEIMILKSL